MTTETSFVDYQQAEDLLRRAMETDPERVFTSNCTYVDFGKPNCLIGVALSLAGIDVSAWAIPDRNSVRMDALVGAGKFPVDLSEAAQVLWGAAQDAQDRGSSWRVAYREAVSTVGRRFAV